MRAFAPLLILISWFLFSATGQAADKVWDGGSFFGNTNWLTSFWGFEGWNWDPNGANPVAGDQLFFDGSSKLENNNNTTAGTSYLGLIFNAGAGGFTLSGNRVTLGANGIVNNSSVLQTINLPLALSTPRTINAATGDLSIGGVISGGGGPIKNGAGTLTLTGANTYTGVTSIHAGTLALSGSGTLGVGSNIVVSADGSVGTTATLNLNGVNASIGSLTLGGPGVGGAKTNTVQTGTGTLTLGGNVLFNGDQGNQGVNSITGKLALGGAARTFTVNGATTSELIVEAIISGNVGLLKKGPGILSLFGPNTYTAATSIDGGILGLENFGALAGGGVITFGGTGGSLRHSSSNTVDYSVRIANSTKAIAIDTNNQNVNWASSVAASNTGGLTKLGAGTLTLAGSNAYTGPTTVSAGTLLVNGSVNSSVTVSSGATLGGRGTVTGNGTLNSGSTHAPGVSAGIATFTGQVSYGAGSIFEWELISNTNVQSGSPPYQFDQVNVGGNLTINAGAIFKIVLNSSPASSVNFANTFWNVPRSWRVFTVAGATTGTFTNSLIQVSVDSLNQNYTNFIDYPTGGFSYVGGMVYWNPVPEPTSALVGVLIGAGLLRRRRTT